ncbi:hypothetical protein ACLKA6_005438 [Drosophila palustris]
MRRAGCWQLQQQQQQQQQLNYWPNGHLGNWATGALPRGGLCGKFMWSAGRCGLGSLGASWGVAIEVAATPGGSLKELWQPIKAAFVVLKGRRQLVAERKAEGGGMQLVACVDKNGNAVCFGSRYLRNLEGGIASIASSFPLIELQSEVQEIIRETRL